MNTIGPLPLGIRRLRSAWQQDLANFLDYAKAEKYAFVDFGPVDSTVVVAARDAGLGVGTVDLPNWTALISADTGLRRAAVVAAASHIRSHATVGVTRSLSVLMPADPTLARKRNMELAIESYRSLAVAAGECGASLLIEGAPGRPPFFANLGCTPADLRLFLSGVDSDAVGVNFDPSHLVRMSIDPIQFLGDFGSRVGHVHAKDTVFIPEGQYEHGTLQEPTDALPHVYGAFSWRYAVPGSGAVPWRAVFEALIRLNFTGGVSIELEDESYLGDEARERDGFARATAFLMQSVQRNNAGV